MDMIFCDQDWEKAVGNNEKQKDFEGIHQTKYYA